MSLMMQLALCPTQEVFLREHSSQIVPDGNGALFHDGHHALTGKRSVDLLTIRRDVLSLLGEEEGEGDTDLNEGMVGVNATTTKVTPEDVPWRY